MVAVSLYMSAQQSLCHYFKTILLINCTGVHMYMYERTASSTVIGKTFPKLIEKYMLLLFRVPGHFKGGGGVSIRVLAIISRQL